MSLRDYAAIQFGCSMISSPEFMKSLMEVASTSELPLQDVAAVHALIYAEAFIRAREGGDA